MSNSKFITGLFIGAAVGAAIAVLCNSDKGKEILTNVKDFASKAGDNIKDVASKLKDEFGGKAEEAKKYGENFAQNSNV
ncbi:MAG: YtxH domain-containing protein [Gemmatimonadaceae bacterium]|nr:YtxH domain-containing protein [Chitinophagaceae bacterium]